VQVREVGSVEPRLECGEHEPAEPEMTGTMRRRGEIAGLSRQTADVDFENRLPRSRPCLHESDENAALGKTEWSHVRGADKHGHEQERDPGSYAVRRTGRHLREGISLRCRVLDHAPDREHLVRERRSLAAAVSFAELSTPQPGRRARRGDALPAASPRRVGHPCRNAASSRRGRRRPAPTEAEARLVGIVDALGIERFIGAPSLSVPIFSTFLRTSWAECSSTSGSHLQKRQPARMRAMLVQ